MEKLTTNELKQQNKRLLLDFIYNKKRTTKLEIAQLLDLSRPTINQLLNELFDLKIIEKNGFYESTGGRKAEAISFVSMAKISIGVELRRNHYEIVAINLYGEILKQHRVHAPFSHTEAYYKQVCADITDFISSLHIAPKRILGIGIVLQGLISFDGSVVTYGKILGCTGLSIDTFQKYLPYKCLMTHDAESATLAELWECPDLKNAVFFHLRTNISGAIIVDGDFLPGLELKSGVFEHMTLVPDGNDCYCGRKGCVDTYCSVDALLPEGETIETYFHSLRSGSAVAVKRWSEYLKYLSMTINNLHMFMDYDIILGGTIARYLNHEDIRILHQQINAISAFPTDREFIKLSATAGIPIAKGAALPFVKDFIKNCT